MTTAQHNVEHGEDIGPKGVLLASRPGRNFRESGKSLLGSLIVHGVVIAGVVWATASAGVVKAAGDEQVTLIEIVPEVPPPPPPPPPTEFTPPTAVEVPLGFLELAAVTIVPPDIPPPQIGVRFNAEDYSGEGVRDGRADGRKDAPPVDDVVSAPKFTPMTVRPELLNVSDVQRELVRRYPALLRDAGIGGTTVVWFLINEQGKVEKTQVSRPSGYEALDEASLEVAGVMRFSPALNGAVRVRVWVEIPIQFRVN